MRCSQISSAGVKGGRGGLAGFFAASAREKVRLSLAR